MKKGILAVSFGTSVPGAWGSIKAVEAALADCAPGMDFFRAYTSPTVRRILAERGETVPGLRELLEELADGQYEELYVQPTHLLYGLEYESIKKTVTEFAPRLSRLSLGVPLLSDTCDLCALASCVTQRYLPDSGALVLVGHGTSHFANMVYPALQTAIRLQGAEPAFVGTIEGWPGFEEVLKQLQACGKRRVVLAPLMLTAGEHTLNDIAGATAESWKSRLENAGFSVNCRMEGLGMLEEVRVLYQNHLREMIG